MRLKRTLRRRREARRRDLRARLADDAQRTVGFMAAVLADATRVGAELPEGVAACLTVWRAWADRLHDWSRGDDER